MLRHEAERLIKHQAEDPVVPLEMLELIHELKVHQAELEIQNEELQRAQQEISTLHQEYRDLYEFAPCGYVVLTPKGLISRINLTGVKLLGCERARLKHVPLSKFLLSGGEQDYYDALQNAAQHEGVRHVEFQVKCEGNAWIRADIRSNLSATGELVEWRLVLTDVTDRRTAQQKTHNYKNKLKSLTSEMALAEERINHALALRVHDNLSQTLAMSRVKLGMVADSLTDPKQKAILQAVYSELGEALNESRLITSELNCPELHIFGLREAVSAWAVQNIKNRHAIDTLVTGNEGGETLAEETKCILFRSLRELFLNVVKYAQASRVEVDIQHTHEQIVVRVMDDGVGFPVDLDLEGLQSGFGLLSIRESMERLGGQLIIGSASDGGATVTLSLPLAENRVEGALS